MSQKKQKNLFSRFQQIIEKVLANSFFEIFEYVYIILHDTLFNLFVIFINLILLNTYWFLSCLDITCFIERFSEIVFINIGQITPWDFVRYSCDRSLLILILICKLLGSVTMILNCYRNIYFFYSGSYIKLLI